jgi:hypothetical protein
VPSEFTGIGEFRPGACDCGFIPRFVELLVELGLATGDVDDLRLKVLRILCSDKGEIDEGSLAMACRPKWPAVYIYIGKTGQIEIRRRKLDEIDYRAQEASNGRGRFHSVSYIYFG